MKRNDNRRQFPTLLDKPSPSLAKINRMNRSELEARIDSLTTEADRVVQKMNRLKGVSSDPPDRVGELTVLADRLAALKKAAEVRLAQFKDEAQPAAGGYRSKQDDLKDAG